MGIYLRCTGFGKELSFKPLEGSLSVQSDVSPPIHPHNKSYIYFKFAKMCCIVFVDRNEHQKTLFCVTY